jgi:RHS repeat-associated protein
LRAATHGRSNNFNRWYDAGVGRWISEDPIGFAGGDANLVRYVGNYVIQFADAPGLRPEVENGAGSGQGAGGASSSNGSDRDKLLDDAEQAGIGDEVKEILEIVDSVPNGPGSGSNADEMFSSDDDDANPNITGKCGVWTNRALCALKNSGKGKDDKPIIDAVNIQQKNNPRHNENQNCIRLRFSDDKGNFFTYYLDDGDVGGADGVFDDGGRQDYQHPGGKRSRGSKIWITVGSSFFDEPAEGEGYGDGSGYGVWSGTVH